MGVLGVKVRCNALDLFVKSDGDHNSTRTTQIDNRYYEVPSLQRLHGVKDIVQGYEKVLKNREVKDRLCEKSCIKDGVVISGV